MKREKRFRFRNKYFNGEISTYKSISLKYYHGQNYDEKSKLVIGFYLFTIFINFDLPSNWYFKRRCIATWDNNREFYLIDERVYGFYFYEWAFVWSFHAKANESSSKDPWWMHQYIHLDDLIFGRTEVLRNEVTSIENIKFKIGDKEFNMDSIKWERVRRFRRFIPISLYCKSTICVDMKIDNPPMRAGKGENSYDCGDDGSFGLSGPWSFQKPNWNNRQECAKLAVKYYVDSCMKDVKKYGGSSGVRGVNKNDEYQYIGQVILNKPENVEQGISI